MTQFTPLASIIGGVLIGCAAVLLYQLNGRIAGISGIVFGIFGADRAQRAWRVLFVVGLVLGGVAYQSVSSESVAGVRSLSLLQAGLGGVLVGIGTRLGSGCTSGHGVCGIARLSIRSLIATAIFVLFGALTATGLHWFATA